MEDDDDDVKLTVVLLEHGVGLDNVLQPLSGRVRLVRASGSGNVVHIVGTVLTGLS